MSEWRRTACILCECNCGIEVQLGGEGGRHFTRIRGDKAHPGSKGYACEKANRLDFYQNGRDRLTAPLRRREDGSFEQIDWDTAIREVAEKLAAVRDTHGGDKIFYYGGGGQGNHLGGAYSRSTLTTLGSKFRSNALAQEKTGEFWVNARTIGSLARGDWENCEVAFFLGKNPWHSHGIPHARVTLKNIAKDPARKMIVVDPRRSETAELADLHLAVRPGGDAWLLSALIAILLQEGLADRAFLEQHTEGGDVVWPHFEAIDVAAYSRKAGVPEARLREAAHILADASSVSFFEDLGVQMNRHSTLVSYLDRLLWALTGSYGKPGAMNGALPLVDITGGGREKGQRSPVAGERIISGLVPCNAIPDEILTDHPDRYRAMIVESGNPVHSVADSNRMREALRSLDVVVAIDIALTETAREADYVLPMATQYEKPECVFFNFEFPENVFYLRKPLFAPPEGVLTEPELHARLVEALGAMPQGLLSELRAAAAEGRDAFAARFMAATGEPGFMDLAPVLLYRSLGETLPEGTRGAAALWGPVQILAMGHPDSVRRAGFEGEGHRLGDALFDRILESPTGVVFAVDTYAQSWERLGAQGGRWQLAIPELFDELDGLADEEPVATTREFPFLLSAGERRSFTANTIFRHHDWRKKDRDGALRISPEDAGRLSLETGSKARITTRAGSVDAVVEVSDRMRRGHCSLPNGMGLANAAASGGEQAGVAPNELTSSELRDPIAGTPWHKSVPARIEAL